MSNYPKPDGPTLRAIYEKAARIQFNDERVIKEIKAGKLVMPFYSTRGQEIIPAAISVSLTDDDYVNTIYRGGHDQIAKGFPLADYWAEIAGRVTGACKGKGGPMHLTYPAKGIMVTTGIVGSTAPIANGLAWAAKLEGKGRVTIANFGDGAANIGAVHEAMNMAALWQLPVIFVCQNNAYAEHTSMARSTRVDSYAKRAAGYAMEGIRVDGNDPDEMYGAARWAIDRARAGEGPTFIEATTFRFNGHLIGEAGGYMDKELYAASQTRDPMPILRRRLVEEGIVAAGELDALDASIRAEIDAAVRTAYAADYPDPSELKVDVLVDAIA
ncbi:thiamine pyrophosphate-dependent dehydrogenase E1 component subunit alpha [Sphingomonas sp. C8-2]|jgi:pyruvate dehydrogenase E1 component alpha subunit|nr:thiamine pyrophosphate-dependent dehydrogenase E1 component subunit alpha [Sphingomonas sp. C8-2]